MTGEAARYQAYGNHPEDWDEFEDRTPKLKPRAQAYAKAKRRVENAKARLDTASREELTLCARLANLMGDKESAHTLALKATKTRPTTGTAPGFD
jgi:Tfp pilus assembly protein PilF